MKTRWQRFWEWLEAKQQPKTRGLVTDSDPCSHRWRLIAAPYVRQCRLCGVVRYQTDANGDFPDGLEDYVELMTAKVRPQREDFPHSFQPVTQESGFELCVLCGKSNREGKHV